MENHAPKDSKFPISPREQSSQRNDLTKSAAFQVSAILTKMTMHYWRPDMTSAQYSHLFEDYIDDMRDFSVEAIERACSEYRANPENKYFPRVGQLLELLKEKHGEPRRRHESFRGLPALNAPRSTKSVADVLESHGFHRAAQAWKR